MQWDGIQGRWIDSETDENMLEARRAAGMPTCFSGGIPGGILAGIPAGMGVMSAGSIGLPVGVAGNFTQMPPTMPMMAQQMQMSAPPLSDPMMMPSTQAAHAPFTALPPPSLVASALDNGSNLASLPAVNMGTPSSLHSEIARKRVASQMLFDEQGHHTTHTEDKLPGWQVLQQTANTARNYKACLGASGEYPEPKRQAIKIDSKEHLASELVASKAISVPAVGPFASADTQLATDSVLCSHSTSSAQEDDPGGSTQPLACEPYGPTRALQRAIERACALANVEIVIAVDEIVSVQDDPEVNVHSVRSGVQNAVQASEPAAASNTVQTDASPTSVERESDSTCGVSTTTPMPSSLHQEQVVPRVAIPPLSMPCALNVTSSRKASGHVPPFEAHGNENAALHHDAGAPLGAGDDALVSRITTVCPARADAAAAASENGAVVQSSISYVATEAARAIVASDSAVTRELGTPPLPADVSLRPLAQARTATRHDEIMAYASSPANAVIEQSHCSTLYSAKGPPRPSRRMDDWIDVKRSRVGQQFQAEPLPLADSTEIDMASEREDELIFNPSLISPESMQAYLKSVSDSWVSNGGATGNKSPRNRLPGGKYRGRNAKSGGAPWLDGTTLELALRILHKHDYDSAAAAAEVIETAPPPHLAAQWSEHDRCAFDHAISACGKDFPAISRLLPNKNVRELVAYFYDRKCRLEIAKGRPAFLDALPIVLGPQRRGIPSEEQIQADAKYDLSRVAAEDETPTGTQNGNYNRWEMLIDVNDVRAREPFAAPTQTSMEGDYEVVHVYLRGENKMHVDAYDVTFDERKIPTRARLSGAEPRHTVRVPPKKVNRSALHSVQPEFAVASAMPPASMQPSNAGCSESTRPSQRDSDGEQAYGDALAQNGIAPGSDDVMSESNVVDEETAMHQASPWLLSGHDQARPLDGTHLLNQNTDGASERHMTSNGRKHEVEKIESHIKFEDAHPEPGQVLGPETFSKVDTHAVHGGMRPMCENVVDEDSC